MKKNFLVIASALFLHGGCTKSFNPPDISKTLPTASTIIYTDISPDTVILKTMKDSFSLDLNNDGVIDFAFVRSSVLDRCSDNLLGTIAYDVRLSIKPAGTEDAVLDNGSVLDSAIPILPDSVWTNSSAELMFFGAYATGHCIAAVQRERRGNWFGVSDKYIGLRIVRENNTYYGWVRLSSTYIYGAQNHEVSNGQLIIKDYAFNSVPNLPILAGQVK